MNENARGFKAGSRWRIIKFCLVGGSGVFVDMAVLHILADSRWFSFPFVLAKALAAEAALINNFAWNEVWTFRDVALPNSKGSGIAQRLLKFHAICGLGILWAVCLLYLFHRQFGLNLYGANLFAIILVTLWNYGLNARFNWKVKMKPAKQLDR